MSPSRPAPLRALPPWLPSPVELAEASTGRAPETPPWWVYASALYTMGAAWLAACAAGALRTHDGVGLIGPLAAIAVVCGSVPLARAARRELRALSVDVVYGALQWLAPWVTLAWVLPASLDSDGGSGGACGYGSMLMGGVALPLAVPALVALLWPVRASPRGATSPAPPRITVVLVAAMTLVSLGLIVARPARASLDRLPSQMRAWTADAEQAGARARLPLQEGIAYLARERGRCVMRYQGAEVETPTCAPRARVWSHWRLRGFPPAAASRDARVPALLDRPHTSFEFVELGGRVFGPGGVPYRYHLFAAPLWEWCAGAALGMFVAGWTVRRARRATAAWRELPVRAGRAEGGCVRLDDGAVLRLPEALASHAGDVVVVGEGLRLTSAFRELPSADGLVVLPVTRAGWSRALADADRLAMSFARAVLWLSSAPLMAAPFLGMFAPWP